MPPLRLATHLFGSSGGYRGLAHSRDLSAAECRELEGFGFGEASDATLLASLETTPSAFGRPLPGGRIAITRLFAGPLDDASRPTLELRSVVASPPDMLEIARGGIERLLGDATLWRREAFAAGHEVPFAAPPPRPLSGAGHLAAFEQWARAASGTGTTRPMLLLEPEAEGSAAVSELLARISPEDLWSLRWGIRLLASGGLAELGTLAPGVRWRGDRPYRRVSPGEGIESPLFARRLAEWPASPMLPPRREAAAWFAETRGVAVPAWLSSRRGRQVGAAALAILVGCLLGWVLLRGDPPMPEDLREAADAIATETPDAGGDRAAGEAGEAGETSPDAASSTAPRGFGIASSPPRSGDGVAAPPQTPEGDDGSPVATDAAEAPASAASTDAEAPPAEAPEPQASPSGEAGPESPAEDVEPLEALPADPCVEAGEVRAKVIERGLELEALLARNPTRWDRIDAVLGEMESSLRTLRLELVEESSRRLVLQLLRERRPALSEATLLEQWPLLRRLHCGWLAWLEASAAIEAAGSRLATRPAMRSLLQLRGEALWVVTSARPSGEALLQRQRALLAGLAADARDQGQPPRFSLWLEEAAAGRLPQDALQSPPSDPQDASGPPVR